MKGGVKGAPRPEIGADGRRRSLSPGHLLLGVDDVERTERAIKGIVGKCLTYRNDW
jgi:hypothetical protein